MKRSKMLDIISVMKKYWDEGEKYNTNNVSFEEYMLSGIEQHMIPKTHYGNDCGEYFEFDLEDLAYIEEMTTYRIGWESENE